jgi:predicted TIM-barrel enzyme
VSIWADVHVKHGRSLAHPTIVDEAEDAVRRGLASALIVSGKATGELASLDDVRAVAAAPTSGFGPGAAYAQAMS